MAGQGGTDHGCFQSEHLGEYTSGAVVALQSEYLLMRNPSTRPRGKKKFKVAVFFPLTPPAQLLHTRDPSGSTAALARSEESLATGSETLNRFPRPICPAPATSNSMTTSRLPYAQVLLARASRNTRLRAIRGAAGSPSQVLGAGLLAQSPETKMLARSKVTPPARAQVRQYPPLRTGHSMSVKVAT